MEHPDVSAASLCVCHWGGGSGVGGGVKVTCFKYRRCHDNTPDSTYKSHLHKDPPFSLYSAAFFVPLPGDGRCTNVVFCLCLGRWNAKRMSCWKRRLFFCCSPPPPTQTDGLWAEEIGQLNKTQTLCKGAQHPKTIRKQVATSNMIWRKNKADVQNYGIS